MSANSRGTSSPRPMITPTFPGMPSDHKLTKKTSSFGKAFDLSQISVFWNYSRSERFKLIKSPKVVLMLDEEELLWSL